MNKLLLVFILLLSACGNPCEDDGILAAGICFTSDHEIDTQEIEYTIWMLENALETKGYPASDLTDVLRENNVTVKILDENLAYKCDKIDRNLYECEDLLGGYNKEGNSIYIRHYYCFAHNSLAHEILHSYEKYYLDSGEDNHLTPWFFYEYADTAGDMDYSEIIEQVVWEKTVCWFESCEKSREFIEICKEEQDEQSSVRDLLEYTKTEEKASYFRRHQRQ